MVRKSEWQRETAGLLIIVVVVVVVVVAACALRARCDIGNVGTSFRVFLCLLRTVLASRWGPLLMAPIFVFLWLFLLSVLVLFGGRLLLFWDL